MPVAGPITGDLIRFERVYQSPLWMGLRSGVNNRQIRARAANRKPPRNWTNDFMLCSICDNVFR